MKLKDRIVQRVNDREMDVDCEDVYMIVAWVLDELKEESIEQEKKEEKGKGMEDKKKEKKKDSIDSALDNYYNAEY